MTATIPSPSFSDSDEPYTFTTGVNTNSFASQFEGMSSNAMGSFTGPDFSSIKASMSSVESSLGERLSSQNIPTSSPTTLATSTLASGSNTNSGSSAINTSGSSAGATANSANSASSTNGSSTSSAVANATDLHQESAGGLSSPGMQAAVAVPVVVAVIAAIAFIFFCMRRRRKRAAGATNEPEKQSPAGRKKKWTRHLRVFSFDAELLMGGRYSSTNSIRSRQTGSVRSGSRSHHAQTPSVHSVEEVAPPYRDAISAAVPPNAGQLAGGAAAAGVARSASSATAPPPYGAAAGKQTDTGSPASPASRHERDNPFADQIGSPVSPIEGSPFNDPPGATAAVSRNSSIYHSERDETSTLGGASDAASIREATLARNASVMSGARVIDHSQRASS